MKLWPKECHFAAMMAAILDNGDSWNCWCCLNHLKWIPHAHKHIFRPKIHDYVTIMSKIMAKNSFRRPFWKMVTFWSFWCCQDHFRWIPHVHKHIFRPKYHDSMTITFEVMSKIRSLAAILENGHCWGYATDLNCLPKK